MCMKSIYLTIMMTVMLIIITWSLKQIVKQRLDEMEHPALITEWTSNMDKSDYKKQEKEEHKPSEKKSLL